MKKCVSAGPALTLFTKYTQSNLNTDRTCEGKFGILWRNIVKRRLGGYGRKISFLF